MEGELEEFRDIVASCYGPYGRVALLQPVPGGHVTITSQSSKIFQLLKSANPMMQLLYASLVNHSLRYYDGTKMAALLTTNIVLNSLHLNCPRRQVADVIDHLLTKSMTYLKLSCIPLDWSSVRDLMNVTKTLIQSHSLCSMDDDHLNHLASLILQAILHVVPCTGNNHSLYNSIHLYLMSEVRIDRSCIYKGLLIEEQHCIGLDKEMSLDVSEHHLIRDPHGHIVVAVFNISLAGDQEDGFSEKLTLDTLSQCLQKEASHQELISLGQYLIANNIGILLCQKCVHSVLRNVLEKHGIVVIERLGINYIDAVINISGGHVISSMMLSNNQLGYLNNFSVVTIGGNRHILLEGPVPHVSLILPYLLELVGEELKSDVTNIKELLYTPSLVCGGGCALTQLAQHIYELINDSSETEYKELMCTKCTFDKVCSILSTSIHQTTAALQYNNVNTMTLSDTQTHHCWVFCSSSDILSNKTCVCGAIQLSSLSNPSWRTINGWKGLDPLIPDSLQNNFNSTNDTSVACIYDTLMHILSALSITKELATTIISTFKCIL